MLTLLFNGWFQCRLPTNPDPADEPRGVSGYTFALANERDLDRIIRFHDPVDPRSHGPQVGVFVRTALLSGQPLPDTHPLVGARVELLDAPKFEAANGILAKEPFEPILPFHLQVAYLPAQAPRGKRVLHARPPSQERPPPGSRKRKKQQVTVACESQYFAAQAGVTDPVAWRQRRLKLLRADRDRSENPLERCALEKRIRELQIPEASKARARMFTERRLHFLNVVEIRRFQLKGHVDPDFDLLPGHTLGTSDLWDAELWMGVWDADALCGFAQGLLNIPLNATRRR